jgi:hypothetical protein
MARHFEEIGRIIRPLTDRWSGPLATQQNNGGNRQ